MNINLAQSSTIASVFLISQQCCPNRAQNTDIRIGTSSTVSTNQLCKKIDQSGIYTCNAPLTGDNVGIQKNGSSVFAWFEIRAYEYSPMTLTESMLSANTMPNASLVSALSLSMLYGELIKQDAVFSVDAAASSAYWSINFCYSQKLKAVLIMGELAQSGQSYTTDGTGWKVTFGDSADPCTNPTIYTQTGSFGGKEILVESSAQYLAVCKSTGTLSLSLVSVFNYPCELDCSVASLADQVYYIQESRSLTLPACVGSKAATVTGTFTSTLPQGFATLTKETNNSFTIQLHSSDISIVGQIYEFHLLFTEITATSGICQPCPFKVQVKCTKTVDCSASIQSDFTYLFTQTTTKTIPACIISPGFCTSTSVGTLSSTGATPPAGFAILTKNTDNSFNLTIFSSDVTTVGQTYIFTLAFTDPSVASVTQPTTSTFSVFVKCLPTSIDCSGSGQNAISYFILNTNTLNIPVCVMIPTICGNTSTATLTSVGTKAPPVGFAVLTQNADSSFKLTLTSSDPQITGENYQFQLVFSASNGVSVVQPQNSTFSVSVKCTQTVDCSSSTLVDQIYFITDINLLTVQACVITPSICPSTTLATFTASGVNIPPGGFSTLSKKTDNSFLITISSSDHLLTGLNYSFNLAFTDTSASLVTQSSTPNIQIQVKCTRTVDCSASILADFDYYLTDLTIKTIPACIITPSVCTNTYQVQITSTGTTAPPAGFFVVTQYNNNQVPQVTFTSNEVQQTGKSYQFTLTFTDSSVNFVTQPTTPTVAVLVKCAKSVDCSGSGQSDQTLLQTAALAIDNTFVLPACAIVPSICYNTSSLTTSSIGTTPSPVGFVTSTKNANNSFTLKFLSNDPLIDGKTFQFMLTFADTAVASVTQPIIPAFTIKVTCTIQIDCSSQLKDFVYFLDEETFLTLEACKNTPAYCPDKTQVFFTQITPIANFVTQFSPNKYTFRIFSNDSKLINKKYQQKLEFLNPTMAVIPTITPNPVITVKCKVKEVTHKNNSQVSFDQEIGKPAFQLQFLEFEQTPSCNFQWTYKLTLIEIKTLTQEVNFAEILKNNPNNEGLMPTGLGKFENQSVYIRTDDVSLMGKSYAAFISGTLATDPVYQAPLKQYFELARFTIFSSKINIANSVPIVRNFVSEIRIFANESREVAIADLSDVENSAALTITNLKAQCTVNKSQWINSSKSTNSQITLVMRVPSDVVDDTCTFEFTVNDNDLKVPLTLTKTVKIIVKSQDFEGVKPIVDQSSPTIKVPEIKESEATSTGIISLKFDQKLLFPDHFFELTSQNEGPSYFNVTLEVNEKNLQENGYEKPNQRRLASTDPYHFTWKVQKTEDSNEIKFAFKFDNPQIISKYAKDKIIVTILRPKEFKASADLRVNLGEDLKNVFLLPFQMQSESEARQIASTAKTVATALTVVFAGTSVGSIAMSIIFVYLMGLINGLQIQALACLFRVRMPPNAMIIMTKLLSLSAFDFFQTEKILNGIFHFQKTPSFSQIFDDAAYTGSNFIIGIGPMFITMVLYVFYLAIRALVLSQCKEEISYQKDRISQLIQKIVNSFRNHCIESTCITFILEGNIDIQLWGFICAIYVRTNGIGVPHSSDIFSNIFAFVCMVFLLIAPLHQLYRAWQFNQHIQTVKAKAIEAQQARQQFDKTERNQANFQQKEEAKQENVFYIDFKLNLKENIELKIAKEEQKKEEDLTQTVTEIFKGFKLNFPSLLFYLFFILRRQAMVAVLIFLPTNGLLQSMVHILCSACILIYAIAYIPYESDLLNFQEICNESFTLLSAYNMILFTDFIADDATVLNTGKNLKNKLGLSFLAIIGTNLFINLAIIVREVLQVQIKRFRYQKIKILTLQLNERRAAQIKKDRELKNQRIAERKVARRMKVEAKEARRNQLRQLRMNQQINFRTVLVQDENGGMVEEIQPIPNIELIQMEEVNETKPPMNKEVKEIQLLQDLSSSFEQISESSKQLVIND